ncbi:hypothetical protein BKA70DRAFT_1559323 [Coprinopsis sp. MPI-PUGE-AT-0042]|nr:hypothetical protein BKA70DRAFT_1559323 [Coprinopsis sp. MPI-PUGE-AT-0042]
MPQLILPPEICGLVLGDSTLSCPDLYAITRTSRVFRALAEPILYERPYILHHDKLVIWAKTMLAHPERGTCVKSLSFYIKSPAIFSFMNTYEARSAEIPEAIALCTNIIELEVLDLSSPPEAENFSFFFQNLKDHPFRCLRSFRNTAFPLTLLNPAFPMAKFFEATPSITTLLLPPHGWQGLRSWSPSMLPHLKTFSGSGRVVKLLTESQPIRQLSRIEVYCKVLDYELIPQTTYVSINMVPFLAPLQGTLGALQLHRDSDSEAKIVGQATTGLFDLVYRAAHQLPELRYLSVLDSTAKYSGRLFLPESKDADPLASKLEVLALRPYKHLDWDPDSVFNINVEPVPAVAYLELETRQARARLMERLTRTFPSLKTVIFDLHYGRVIRFTATARGDLNSGGVIVAETLDETLDEELWMYM